MVHIIGSKSEIDSNPNPKPKPKWVQPIHPIPSSMFKLSEAEKSELEDVLYSMSLESCGFLWNSKKQNNSDSDYCPVVALEDKTSETKGLFMPLTNNFNHKIYQSDLLVLLNVRNFYCSNIIATFQG